MNYPILAALLLSGPLPVFATDPPASLGHFLRAEEKAQHGLSDTVWQMLTDAGQTAGFQGGKAERSWELRHSLTTRDSVLNDMYDFRPLISRQGYLPPVITTATDLAHIEPGQMRTAYRTWNIVVPARFVSNPPGWRSWLLPGLTDKHPEEPDISIRPKNRKERAAWEAAVQRGWEEGRQSADRTLEANFNRLTRDYTGMLRYSILLQQGMIQAPDIRETQQSVTGTHDELMIGDRVQRIQDPAAFIVDKRQWQPVIRREAP